MEPTTNTLIQPQPDIDGSDPADHAQTHMEIIQSTTLKHTHSYLEERDDLNRDFRVEIVDFVINKLKVMGK